MTTLQRVKRAVRHLLGADLTVGPPQEPIVGPFGRFADLLEKHGLRPATVVDIGVAWGTPWLYERWPAAKFYLVDPTPQSLPHMQAAAEKLDADILNLALGEDNGSIAIKISENHGGSSVYDEVEAVPLIEERTVELRRYDSVIPEGIARPVVVKIDVQGAEVAVLRGMGGRLAEVEAVIVEVSLIATLKDAPEFAEVLKFMDQHGFVLQDMIGALRRPLDGALAQIDAVFVPQTSPLRSDRRWG